MMAAKCGHSFSKASITAWLRQNHPTCPVCKTALEEGQLVPNYALRSAIERYATTTPASAQCMCVTKVSLVSSCYPQVSAEAP
jgi:F-box/WD-40 domain protein 7